MTEDISNYSFDLEREAKTLLAELGRKGKRILIAATEVTHPAGYIGAAKVDVPLIVSRNRLRQRKAAAVREHINYTYNKRPYLGSYEKAVFPAFSRNYFYISLRKDAEFIRQLGPENEDLMRLFILYHEAGHALISPLPDTPAGEHAADAYAALRLLQRFGAEAAPFLSRVSRLRTERAAISGSTSHLTTAVLDKIIRDSARRDFPRLTPAETVQLAKDYADAAKATRPARQKSFACKP
jgi:hypothetical protein